MTRTGAIARPPIEDRSESFIEWVQTHVRELVIAVIVVAALIAGGWLYRNSRDSKELQAERSLYEAERAVMSGNLPLAASDLQKVTTRFENTTAGVQAALLLAQVQFEQKKYAEGIQALEQAEDETAAEPFRASIHALMAAGYEDQGKFREAAQAYREASEETKFEAEKELYLAHAARAYQAAGDRNTALQLWTELAENESSSVAGEARIRVGELTAAG